jgi:hypothetical protein
MQERGNAKCKMQNGKRKGKTRRARLFLLFICHFAFFILHFAFTSLLWGLALSRGQRDNPACESFAHSMTTWHPWRGAGLLLGILTGFMSGIAG